MSSTGSVPNFSGDCHPDWSAVRECFAEKPSGVPGFGEPPKEDAYLDWDYVIARLEAIRTMFMPFNGALLP